MAAFSVAAGPTTRVCPRNKAMTEPLSVITVMSWIVLRPRLWTGADRAMRRSPARAGATKSMAAKVAKAVRSSELLAKAMAVSANVNKNPPWQVSRPLTMVSVTVMAAVQDPSDTETISMPKAPPAAPAADGAGATRSDPAPTPWIVDFMCASVDEVLQKEFNTTLGGKDVWMVAVMGKAE